MLSLVDKKPEVHAKKLMSVLIRWTNEKYHIKGTGEEPFDKKIRLEEGEDAKETEKREDNKIEKTQEEKQMSKYEAWK